MSTPSGPYSAPGDPWSAGSQPNPAYPGQPVYPQQGGYPAQPGYPQPGYQAQPGYPGQPQYAAGYGMPAYPGGPMGGHRPDPGPPPARPVTVTAAFGLWMVIMVVGIVAVVVLFTSNYLTDLLAQASVADPLFVRTAVNLGRTISVVSAAVAIFIYLFFGIKMLLGRQWARVVLTVLGGLSVLSNLVDTSQQVDGVQISVRPEWFTIMGYVQGALAAVAIILMFLPDSNTYFKLVKARMAYQRVP